MKQRLVIIGGVAAGMSAAAKARRTNRDLEIVVYEKSGYISYGACGFPYFIKGEIPNIEALIMRSPHQMARQGVEAHVHHEVVAIDPQRRTVQVFDHATGRSFVDHWDKLIVAAGAAVNAPPIPGIQLAGVFTLRTVEDAMAIHDWLRTAQPKHAVIVGAGYIGVEMAETLRAHGLNVTIVDMASQVMPTLDADMASHVAAALAEQGVNLVLEQPVRSFVGPAQVREIVRKVMFEVQRQTENVALAGDSRLRVREVVTDDAILPADMVIFGVGTRPNVAIAEAAGVKIGRTGAIAVDAQQRTNVPNIWAAGAVAEAFNVVTNAASYNPTALTANKQGRVAGVNAAGGAAQFGSVTGTAVVKCFDLTIAHSGLTEKYAHALGFAADAVLIKASSRAHYMPGSMPIHVKLVFEQQSQRLLGAQMVGKDGVAKRIDVVAAGLRAGWTTHDLTDLDLSYAPPFAPVWDPLLVAARVVK